MADSLSSNLNPSLIVVRTYLQSSCVKTKETVTSIELLLERWISRFHVARSYTVWSVSRYSLDI